MHPFCKYAPQNDILPEQMYYKFSQLAMIDLGTEPNKLRSRKIFRFDGDIYKITL
jgi:hypothetical protein